MPPPHRNALVQRFKIMAKLDISEKRKPQDGKIRFRGPMGTIELRVATIPTAGGNEDVVMRILAASKPLPIEKMGFSERNLKEFKKILSKPYGICLVVGPTGSGKTTTLHSGLGFINTVDMKIWTAEDPVEITQPGLRQVQVHPKIDFTFAAAMRAFLRADPDVIMVGEMRDHETAAIGIEASLTGHLVFSTLHTNSAPETITRLLDMEIDPFNFADALLGHPGPAPRAHAVQGVQGGLRPRPGGVRGAHGGVRRGVLGRAGHQVHARASRSTGPRAARSAATPATRAAWASTSCWWPPTRCKRLIQKRRRSRTCATRP